MGSSWGKRSGGRFGDSYDKFRTGLSYSDVRSMLWSQNDDPGTWRYKRRHTVLGLWHSLKKDMWAEVERREDEAEAQAAKRKAGGSR